MISPPPDLEPGGHFDHWDPQPIRYAVCDLDGTVITGDGTITNEVVDAAGAVIDAGVPIGFATGRLRWGAVNAYDRLSAPGPHIFCNGAEVRADGATVASWPLSTEAVDHLFSVLVENGSYGEFYTEEGYFYLQYRDGAEEHWNILGWEPIGEISHPDEIEGDILKMTTMGFDREEEERLESSFADSGLEVGSASAGAQHWRFINVTSSGVNKGRALETAAQHLQIPFDSILAVGDGRNDLPMLSKAGTAVAMGQASDQIKTESHLVAPSVTEDGLAVALRQLVVE